MVAPHHQCFLTMPIQPVLQLLTHSCKNETYFSPMSVSACFKLKNTLAGIMMLITVLWSSKWEIGCGSDYYIVQCNPSFKDHATS